MPIAPLTDHVAGTVMNLATLIGNNDLIEAYIKGEIDPADFSDQLGRAHGVPGEMHRVYVTGGDDGLDTNPSIRYDPLSWTKANYGTPIPLDRDCELDFSVYNNDSLFRPIIGSPEYLVPPERFISNWVWEKLGSRPKESGGANYLVTCPDSWHNWIYHALPPGDDPSDVGVTGFVDARSLAGRFENEGYYDRWLTVPYCSKRIWIPDPCTLYVVAMAHGTFNHNMTEAGRRDNIAQRQGVNVAVSKSNFYVRSNIDRCAVFRLFIDCDGADEDVIGEGPFRWETNGYKYNSNWSTLQDVGSVDELGVLIRAGGHEEVGYEAGNQLGMEWSFSCWPRAVARVASKVYIPRAGYYNISFRYNSRYFHGITKEGGMAWEPNRFARTTNVINYAVDDDVEERPGPIHIARWEKTQLGMVAHFTQYPLSHANP